ncbi:hypothetical protein protein [Bacillus cereus G9241]|nr:hypothetical protein protein [Bacillus cereus G9241]EAL13193.1 hypothetical protein protein [Bacillus cereus G9241]EAL14340.1 hypothetical protein protein [Bacillus cereus G9241]
MLGTGLREKFCIPQRSANITVATHNTDNPIPVPLYLFLVANTLVDAILINKPKIAIYNNSFICTTGLSKYLFTQRYRMNKKTKLVIQIVKYDFILFTTRSSIDGTPSSFKRFCSLYSEITYKMTSATFDIKIVPHEILKIIKLTFSTSPAKNKLPMNRITSCLLIHDQPLYYFYISTSANSSQRNKRTALVQIKQMAYQHFHQQLNYINSILLN